MWNVNDHNRPGKPERDWNRRYSESFDIRRHKLAPGNALKVSIIALSRYESGISFIWLQLHTKFSEVANIQVLVWKSGENRLLFCLFWITVLSGLSFEEHLFTIHEPFQLRVITYLLLNSSNAQSRARFLVNLDSSRVIKQSGQVRRNSNEPIKFCQPPKRARQDSTCVISHNQRTSSSQVHVGMSLTRMTNGFQFSKQTYSDNQWFPVHCNGEKDRETPAKTWHIRAGKSYWLDR